MTDKFRKSEYCIKPIDIEKATELVKKWHYAKGGSKQAVYLFGLFNKSELEPCGVSWWIPPAKGSVDKYNSGNYKTTLSLHRLVIEPDRPTNAASYLIGQSIKWIKRESRFDFLITYADTWQNHTGVIYRATNWDYRGLSEPSRVYVNKEGRLKGTKNGGGGAYNSTQLAKWGYSLVGYYPKHVYTMQLPKAKINIAKLGLKVKKPNPTQQVFYFELVG